MEHRDRLGERRIVAHEVVDPLARQPEELGDLGQTSEVMHPASILDSYPVCSLPCEET